MKRMCSRFLLPPAFLVPITAFFICFFPSSLQFVVTGKKVGSKILSLSDFPAHFSLLFRDTVAIDIPMFGDLSLLFLRVKAECTRKASFWQTCLCRHCIFMSILLSSAAVSCLIFSFHSYYAVKGLKHITPNILNIVIKAHDNSIMILVIEDGWIPGIVNASMLHNTH